MWQEEEGDWVMVSPRSRGLWAANWKSCWQESQAKNQQVYCSEEKTKHQSHEGNPLHDPYFVVLLLFTWMRREAEGMPSCKWQGKITTQYGSVSWLRRRDSASPLRVPINGLKTTALEDDKISLCITITEVYVVIRTRDGHELAKSSFTLICGPVYKTGSFCEVHNMVEQPPLWTRDTKLAVNLQPTLLYLPCKLDED